MSTILLFMNKRTLTMLLWAFLPLIAIAGDRLPDENPMSFGTFMFCLFIIIVIIIYNVVTKDVT